jgi:diguanylate cyclase (GGDEF)-like protein
MSIFSLFYKKYAFTKDALKSCKEDILQHNGRSLLLISFLAFVFIGLCSPIPILYENRMDTFIVYLCAAAIELLVSIFISHMCKRGRYSRAAVIAGFLIFYICIMGFGIYIDTIQWPEQRSAIVLIFLICCQILFVFNPFGLLCLNLMTLAVYIPLVIIYKAASFWRYDVINAGIASLIGMLFAWYMSHVIIREILTTRRLEIERNSFREESIRDELTGLSNRRDYLHGVNFYINVCRHVHQTVCVIMMDVDFFKHYNDFYGHQKGDLVLQSIGRVLRQLMSEEHVYAARVGGEEFIILWTENRIAEAERVAVKLRQMIIDLKIPHEKSNAAPYVTASFGLYILRGGSTDSIEELYNNADTALYKAKNSGRNCIILLDSADKVMRPVEVASTEEAPTRWQGRRRGR